MRCRRIVLPTCDTEGLQSFCSLRVHTACTERLLSSHRRHLSRPPLTPPPPAAASPRAAGPSARPAARRPWPAGRRPSSGRCRPTAGGRRSSQVHPLPPHSAFLRHRSQPFQDRPSPRGIPAPLTPAFPSATARPSPRPRPFRAPRRNRSLPAHQPSRQARVQCTGSVKPRP